MQENAHDRVLRACRKTRIGGWVMRGPNARHPEACHVFNLSPSMIPPYREHVAKGDTWEDVLAALEAEEATARFLDKQGADR